MARSGTPPVCLCCTVQADVEAVVSMCTAENVDQLLQGQPDFVLDAIDNIHTKVRQRAAALPARLAHTAAPTAGDNLSMQVCRTAAVGYGATLLVPGCMSTRLLRVACEHMPQQLKGVPRCAEVC